MIFYTIYKYKLLDILSKVVDFGFKGSSSDEIVINKQAYASWSSNKRGHHFVFNKSLLKEVIEFLLDSFFFCVRKVIMILVIGIPIRFDPTSFLQTFF